MKLIQKTTYWAMGLGLLVFLSLVQAQESEISSQKITDQIYMITGKGGNIGIFVGKDGTFVIDDKFAPLTDQILEAIKSVGGDTPKYLLNTHFHGDHTGGNENIGNLGTIIISHDNVRERLQAGSFIKAFDMKTPPAQKAALPVITFSQDMHLHINGETVTAIHAPLAHTDGDSFVYFEKANVLHAGDIFFNGFYPFIDAANGGSVSGVIGAVESILAITNADTKIIPGHGPLANRMQLQAYKDMLITAHANLLALKKQGLTAEQAIEREPLKSLDEKWGGAMFSSKRWIEVVYPAVN